MEGNKVTNVLGRNSSSHSECFRHLVHEIWMFVLWNAWRTKSILFLFWNRILFSFVYMLLLDYCLDNSLHFMLNFHLTGRQCGCSFSDRHIFRSALFSSLGFLRFCHRMVEFKVKTILNSKLILSFPSAESISNLVFFKCVYDKFTFEEKKLSWWWHFVSPFSWDSNKSLFLVVHLQQWCLRFRYRSR